MHRATEGARRARRLVIGPLVLALLVLGIVGVVPAPAGAPPQTASLWAPTVVPGTTASSDSSSVELGVKFQSDVDGFATGVRFYKGAGNTGTHVGSLWATDGTRLATVTFSGETGAGWQQANFASPVALTANTTYIVSYYAPAGHYAFDGAYFGSAGVDNGVLHAPSNTVTANGVYGVGNVFPDRTFNAANYWVDVVFSWTPPEDLTPPTVVSTTPAANATGVPIHTAAIAQFDEAVQPASIAMTLAGPGSTPVPGAVTYDAPTRSARFTPNVPLTGSTVYTATVGGAQDAAGNAMTAPFSWSFTTGTGHVALSSLWPDLPSPATPAVGDGSSVELGVKFVSDVDGLVTGVRFYKGPGNTGTHTGSLWSLNGTRLASVTYTNESASGWQEASFTTPVAITAGTTYIVSYLAPAGHYAYDVGYFGNFPVDSGVLHATTDGNGVFGAPDTFPNQTFQASNYWVDVVVAWDSSADTTPPTVVQTTPAAGAPAEPASLLPIATFSEPVQPSTITMSVTSGSGDVPGAARYVAKDKAVRFTPSAPLAPATNYTVNLSNAQDVAGNSMAPMSWSFSTGAAPLPLGQGPGGPILVVTTAGNPFTSFYAEILRNEGYNEFATADISDVSASMLGGYATVVLGAMPLTSAKATMFHDWVTAGGNLIAMRPDKNLASLLGLTDSSSTLANAYLKVDTTASPGAGITDQTIQFHGTADRYALDGASTVATLYSDANTPTTNPAVTLRSVGTHGGQAAAFTYDLAASVVYTRQGNPAWVGQLRDGYSIARSDDLFFGAAPSDPQPDWVDLSKVAIPQADEQQRLLGNLLTQMTFDQMPLPHFWYLPHGYDAAVVMTGDDHANGGTSGRFDHYKRLSTPGCDVANWQCIRSSSYIFPGTPMSDAQGASYTTEGFEIGTHVTISGGIGCRDYTPDDIASAYSTQMQGVAAQLPSVPQAVTTRMHCTPWTEWTGVPKQELADGIRLDTDYYYFPTAWIQDRPGYFTGSGMPMRFADTDGSMIDVYQATTQLTDEVEMSSPASINAMLDNATGALGYYGVITVNAHTDYAPSTLSDDVLTSAAAHGVPVVSGRQMLTWLDGRNASSFRSMSWNGSTLTFDVTDGGGANGLQALLPAEGSGRTLAGITHDGSAVPYTLETIKGVQYARFAALPGGYAASYSGAGTVAVTLAPASIAADGTSHATATATVKDAQGNPAPGHSVTFTTSGDVTFSTVSDNGDGTYSAQITASTTSGSETITAHDGSVTGTATLVESSRQAAKVAVALTPASIVADGTSQATAIATVTDANGNRVSGDAVTFTTDGDVTFGAVVDNGDGTYSAQVTASTTSGSETITGHDGSLTGSATLAEAPGPAADVAVALVPTSIAANGTSHATATATVTDANGNRRKGDTVTFTTDGDVTFGAVVDNGDGTYSAQVTASTTSGSETVTAHDGSLVGSASLTEVSAPTVSSVTPSSRGQGAANQNLTVAGTGFASGATVAFSGSGVVVNSVTRNSSTSLTVNVTVAASAATGARNVTVTNLDGATSTLAGGFTVNAAPTVVLITPSSQRKGTTQTVTITGVGFVPGATVALSGNKITVGPTTVGLGGTTLTASVTVQSNAGTGTRDVTVTNGDQGTRTLPNAYRIT